MAIVDASVLDRELNPEQAAAAKKKIAHLVSQYQVEPRNILAVTFTNKAAREMTARIQKLLDCNMRFPWMGTFHSVCLRLLKKSLAMETVAQAMGGSWYDANFSIYDERKISVMTAMLPKSSVCTV